MKKVLFWVGIVVAVVILAVGSFATFVAIRGIPKYDIENVKFSAASTPERVARGRHLAMTLCADCHMNPETKVLTGREIVDLPTEFGRAWSRNITQDKAHGLGGWTDAQIAYSLRTGISSKDGRYLPPWMPKFNHMSDEDVASIISWLRSDDPLVAAAPVANIESEPTFLVKFLATIAFKPLPWPNHAIPVVDSSNTVKYGKYLATGVYDCYSCHSGDFKTMDALVPENSGDFFAGGNQMPDANHQVVSTPNLTPHASSAIAKWTREEFITSLRSGFRPNGTIIRYPMFRAAHLTDHELGSIYDYLKTIPAIDKARGPAEKVQLAANASKGERAFVQYNCVGCHTSTGSGIGDLTKANLKYESDSVLTDVILNITNYYPETSMPVWNGHIKSEDLSDLVAHVRKLGKK